MKVIIIVSLYKIKLWKKLRYFYLFIYVERKRYAGDIYIRYDLFT